MSSKKTSNLNLHQWEGADAVSRAEFNENFAKLDGESAAIRGVIAETAATIPRIVMGTYVGDGNRSYGQPTAKFLGFRPKLLVVTHPRYNSTAILVDGGDGDLGFTLTDTGFTYYSTTDDYTSFDVLDFTYAYLAIG